VRVRVRLGAAVTGVALCVGLVLAGVAGCGPSTHGQIVGTWVTGTGATGGQMEFTADGTMTQAHNPPTKYVVVGEEVRSAAEGGRVMGKIVWVSEDRIIYTTLTPGCDGLTLTYDRKK
jgi:hypothetical protein